MVFLVFVGIVSMIDGNPLFIMAGLFLVFVVFEVPAPFSEMPTQDVTDTCTADRAGEVVVITCEDGETITKKDAEYILALKGNNRRIEVTATTYTPIFGDTWTSYSADVEVVDAGGTEELDADNPSLKVKP